MANMSPQKVPMPQQDAASRAKNFKEVALGYSIEMAKEEAERCLSCKNSPCVSGCPVNVQIPDFIKLIKEGDLEGAYQKIKETNALPAVCGRVCPQENQCESKCVRGIKGESVAIGRLERFVADRHMAEVSEKPQKFASNGKKVAVIGSGPASLTCAGDLAKAGFAVTIFEAFHTAGGVLMYGIPQFRLPKEIVKTEIENLKAMGVTIQTDMVVGKIFSVDELLADGFDAVFIGSGAGLPSFMNIPGENLNGVYSANEFLTRINLMRAYQFPLYDTPVFVGDNTVILGGGNVAMDAARCAKRLGAKNVTVLYRRGEDELPARKEEVEHAKEEGITFQFLTAPTEVLGENGWVSALKCVKMELGEPDESGRRRPVVIEGSDFTYPCDCAVVAIGQSPNPLIKNTTPGLEINRRQGIVINEETGETSIPNVYAGGDAVTGAATVILAMGAGKKAAAAMIKKFS